MEGWVGLDKSLLNGAKKNLIKHCIGWLCRSIGRSCIEGGRVTASMQLLVPKCFMRAKTKSCLELERGELVPSREWGEPMRRLPGY